MFNIPPIINNSERTLKGKIKSMVVNHSLLHHMKQNFSSLPTSSMPKIQQKHYKTKIEVKKVEKRDVREEEFFVNLLLGSSNIYE
jgi:hypothetical protein